MASYQFAELLKLNLRVGHGLHWPSERLGVWLRLRCSVGSLLSCGPIGTRPRDFVRNRRAAVANPMPLVFEKRTEKRCIDRLHQLWMDAPTLRLVNGCVYFATTDQRPGG